MIFFFFVPSGTIIFYLFFRKYFFYFVPGERFLRCFTLLRRKDDLDCFMFYCGWLRSIGTATLPYLEIDFRRLVTLFRGYIFFGSSLLRTKVTRRRYSVSKYGNVAEPM